MALLNIPAVASTEGTVQNVTWREDGIYTAASPVTNPERFFVYIQKPGGTPYILRQENGLYTVSGSTVTLPVADRPGKPTNPPFGSTIKFLRTVAATFQVPPWCTSWSLRNISGADMFFRRYAPNVEANVVDTSAVTFGENGIVGQRLGAGQPVGFLSQDFTPGCSYILCAAIAAANGAIVDFYA